VSTPLHFRLQEVRRAAPPIQVAADTVLHPQPGDDTKPSYAPGYVDGTGAINNPFRYRSAADVSPHFALVDLWLAYRPDNDDDPQQTWAQANTWLVRLTPEGIEASEAGTRWFTKLLP
jgi:hypothetical protein